LDDIIVHVGGDGLGITSDSSTTALFFCDNVSEFAVSKFAVESRVVAEAALLLDKFSVVSFNS
jgi:hypothetical protein